MMKSDNSAVVFHKDWQDRHGDYRPVHADGEMSIRTNGKPDASISMVSGQSAADEATMVLAAALPLAYRPEARTAANIGLGSGLTTHTLLCSPRLTRVDTIRDESNG